MLIRSKQLTKASVISLHTSHIIGELGEAIINPSGLEIAGYYCNLPQPRPEPMVLLSRDIRQAMPKRVFINSIDEVTAATALMRYQEIMELKFGLIGKTVKTVSKKRLGKVEEYVIDSLNWRVQTLHVKQSLLRSLSESALIIDRQQIVEVSDTEVTVRDATIAKPAIASQRAATP